MGGAAGAGRGWGLGDRKGREGASPGALGRQMAAGAGRGGGQGAAQVVEEAVERGEGRLRGGDPGQELFGALQDLPGGEVRLEGGVCLQAIEAAQVAGDGALGNAERVGDAASGPAAAAEAEDAIEAAWGGAVPVPGRPAAGLVDGAHSVL